MHFSVDLQIEQVGLMSTTCVTDCFPDLLVVSPVRFQICGTTILRGIRNLGVHLRPESVC